MGCKNKSHRKEFFSVRCGAVIVLTARRINTPCKISGVPSLVHIHICPCPFPDAVELFPAVHLNAEHHSVGHALGPGIMIAGILHIAHVISEFMVYAFIIRSVEHGIKDLIQTLLSLIIADTDSGKSIPVFSGVKTAFHVISVPFIQFYSYDLSNPENSAYPPHSFVLYMNKPNLTPVKWSSRNLSLTSGPNGTRCPFEI